MLATKWSLGLEGGVVIANPIPDADAMDAKDLEQRIEQAIRDAEERHVHGNLLTPFLLSRLEELTGGKSLETNVQLLINNARLGAEIAVALGA